MSDDPGTDARKQQADSTDSGMDVEALSAERSGEKSGLRRLAPLLLAALGVLGLGVLIGALIHDGGSEQVVAEGEGAPATRGPNHKTHPFAADAPDGFELVTAAPGGWSQTWGDDSTGNDSPFTVVSDGTRMVTVLATGFEGMQGKLDQAFAGYSPDNETLTVNGHSALYGAPVDGPDAEHSPGGLIVEMGDNVAIALSGAGVTREELISLAGHASPAPDHLGAPVVARLPAPWKVLGSVDADVLGAIDGYFEAGSNAGPGPSSGMALGWTHDGGRLSAVTLRGEAADLEAFAAPVSMRDGMQAVGHEVTVGGRPGVVLEIGGRSVSENSEWYVASLLTHAESGALVVVSVSVSDPSIISESDLIAVAESFRPVDHAKWDETALRLRVEAAGGPGLHPDAGRAEIGRGSAGGLEWLLQNSDDPQAISEAGSVDTCLKLSDYTRSCASPSMTSSVPDIATPGNEVGDSGPINWDQSIAASTYFSGRAKVEKEFPPFIITTMSVSGGADMNGFTMRATSDSDTVSSKILPVPGTKNFVAVIFLDDVDTAICTTDPAPPPGLFKPVRLEVLGRKGEVLACLGI